MRVQNIRIHSKEGGSELSADVSVEKPRPERYHIWFRGPEGCFGQAPAGDVFFTAFWIFAMFLQEEFVLEGEVSRDLLDAGYGKVEPVLLRWHRHDLKPARATGLTVVDAAAPRSPGVGCLFSGGVDSSYSIIKNLDSITHLVFVHGFELDWRRTDLADRALDGLRRTAGLIDRPLLVLRTNLQEPLIHLVMRSGELGRARPGFLADHYFGTMLVTFNLCLRGILGRAIIPASWSYEHMEPHGSHPLIDPAWTTPTMEIVLDGCEADRIGKLRLIMERRPEMLRELRVCVLPPDQGKVNCGRCSKCLRTMLEMRVAGAEDYSNFVRPLDLELARCTKFSLNGALLPDIRRAAEVAGDREVVEVIRIAQGEKLYWPRIRHRLRARWDEARKARKRRGKLARRGA